MVVDGLAQRPTLPADADATIAAALQSRTADVGAVLETLQSWGWIPGGPGWRAQPQRRRRGTLGAVPQAPGMLEARQLTAREAPDVVPIATLPATSQALRRALATRLALPSRLGTASARRRSG